MTLLRLRARSSLRSAAPAAVVCALALAGCPRGGTESLPAEASPVTAPAELREKIASLKKENAQLEARLEKLLPKDPFIVVNTTLNRIYLRRNEGVLLDATCSTGSNTELVTEDGSRRWFFSTPRGVFRVRSRMERPIWVRPDWAFIEEGLPVPGASHPDRFERGVLGEYGLYFGDGYLIHGTLFQRFLGQSVTHGCVRVGNEDLQTLWDSTRIGTPIYIY